MRGPPPKFLIHAVPQVAVLVLYASGEECVAAQARLLGNIRAFGIGIFNFWQNSSGALPLPFHGFYLMSKSGVRQIIPCTSVHAFARAQLEAPKSWTAPPHELVANICPALPTDVLTEQNLLC